jgi:hypothetical protein
LGGVLTSLVWLLDGEDASKGASERAATPHLDCPPAPPPKLDRNNGELDPESLERPPAVAGREAEVQAMLSDAMTSVSVGASFDLDCAMRPCLAVFAGQIPDEEDRSAVIQRLVESHPGIHLRSTTILGEAGRVSWVLGLADGEPTREEQALVDMRIEDLLLAREQGG